MRNTFLILLVVIFIGCSKDDSTVNSSPIENVGTKNITVKIELPENSTFSVDELTISSLFSDQNPIENGSGNVEVFDNDAFELIIVKNPSGRTILMGYLNPIKQDEIIINSNITARSLSMLHTWTMHMDVSLREEVFMKLQEFEGFERYHQAVEGMIKNGELQPLDNSYIFNSLNLDNSSSNLYKVQIDKKPLILNGENNQIEIVNDHSSLAYGITINSEMGDGDSKIIRGVDKKLLQFQTLVNLFSGNFNYFSPTKIEIDLPNEAKDFNQIIAKNGFNFDGSSEDKEALYINGINIVSSFVSIISTTAGAIIENYQCSLSTGEFFVKIIEDQVKGLTQGDLSKEESAKGMIASILSYKAGLYSVMKDCTNLFPNENSFIGLINDLSLVSNVENGIVLLYYINDIYSYENTIQFCINNTETNLVECESKEVSSQLFGYRPGFVDFNYDDKFSKLDINNLEEITIIRESIFPNIGQSGNITSNIEHLFYNSQDNKLIAQVARISLVDQKVDTQIYSADLNNGYTQDSYYIYPEYMDEMFYESVTGRLYASYENEIDGEDFSYINKIIELNPNNLGIAGDVVDLTHTDYLGVGLGGFVLIPSEQKMIAELNLRYNNTNFNTVLAEIDLNNGDISELGSPYESTIFNQLVGLFYSNSSDQLYALDTTGKFFEISKSDGTMIKIIGEISNANFAVVAKPVLLEETRELITTSATSDIIKFNIDTGVENRYENPNVYLHFVAINENNSED